MSKKVTKKTVKKVAKKAVKKVAKKAVKKVAKKAVKKVAKKVVKKVAKKAVKKVVVKISPKLAKSQEKPKTKKVLNLHIIEKNADGKKFWEIEGVKTVAGNTVASSNKKLIEALMAEALDQGGLNPYAPTLFSAYCTQRDFIETEEIHYDQIVQDELAEDFIAVTSVWTDPSGIFSDKKSPLPNFVHAHREKFEAWFDQLGLGKGFIDQIPLEVIPDNVYQAFKDYFSNYTVYQKTALCLIKGNFGGGCIVPPMVVEGLFSFEDFENMTTLGYQIDDPEYHKYLSKCEMISKYLEATGRKKED